MPGKHQPTHEDRENAEELVRRSFERLEKGDEESARALAEMAREADPDTARKVFAEEMAEEAKKKRAKPKSKQ